VRAGFGVAVGVASMMLGVFLRTQVDLDAAWCGAAFALAVASLLAAYVTKPERDPYLLLGPAIAAGLLALLMPILAWLEPSVRAMLVPAALESAGGFTLLAAAIRWSQANARRALGTVGIDRKRKVRVERNKKMVDVAAEALVAGDEVHLSPGDDVPADGLVIEGSGFVDETILTGPALPAAKKPGDAVLAGSDSTIPELIVRVEAPLSESVLAQREALLPGVVDDLVKRRRIDVVFFAGGAVLSIAGSLVIAAKAGLDHVEAYLPAIAALLIAASAGPAMLAVIRGRLRVLAIARGAGLILLRARDVYAWPRVRRWQIDASLLASPGGVETVAFAEQKPETLLLIAHALLSEETSPEASSVSNTVRAKKLEGLPAAALRRQGSLYLGTVDGHRWWMGPPRAAEEEERIKVEKSMEGPIEFLRDRGMITWLIGRPGGEIAGAIGIAIEADLDAKTAAAKLNAAIMPGPPDFTRKALSVKAGIRPDGPPVGRNDGTLLADRSPPPSSGLRVRVSPIKTRITLDEDRSPRLFLPSLGSFGDAVVRAKRAIWTARVRAVLLAVVPAIVAVVLALFNVLYPIMGAALALIALAFAGRIKA
jgi:hypothetical protein